MQNKIIQKLSEEKPCIFIGRCADYILRDNPNCVNVFISADMDDRIKRLSKQEKLPVQFRIYIVRLLSWTLGGVSFCHGFHPQLFTLKSESHPFSTLDSH